MKILFNNTIFFNQRFGGISRYFVNLINGLNDFNIEYLISSPIYKNIYLEKIKKNKIRGIYLKRFPNYKFIKNTNNILEKLILRKFDPKIIHDTYYSQNLYENTKYKKVITIHDLIHEKYKEIYNKNIIAKLNDKKKAIENSDSIICVSESTKIDLLNTYNISDKKVKVIYHGADHLDNVDIKNIDIDIDKNFILFIGARSKYKNFELLIKAFSYSKRLKKNFDLICFGGGKFSKNEMEVISKFNVLDNIKLIVKNDDATLKFLYSKAALLAVTSELEGFGLPILEALKNNCKVLASNIPVFKEIGKEYINYFEKNNVDSLIYELERNIDSIIDSKNQLKHVENFKWSLCAKKTFELYDQT